VTTGESANRSFGRKAATDETLRGPDVGLNPFRWRDRVQSYVDRVAPLESDRRIASLQRYSDSFSAEEQASVETQLRRGVVQAMTTSARNRRYALGYQVISTIGIGLLAVVVLLLVDTSQEGAEPFVESVVMLAVLVAIFFARALIERVAQRRRLVAWLALAAALVLSAQILDRVTNAAPGLINEVQDGLRSGAYAGAFAIFLLIFLRSVLDLAWAALYRKTDARQAELMVIDRLTKLLAEEPPIPVATRRYVTRLEYAARAFQRDWPHAHRVGLHHVDHQLRCRAAKVAAAVRKVQVDLVLGRQADPRPAIAEIVANIILKRDFDDLDDVAPPIGDAGWARQVGQVALACALGLATIAVFLLLVWQPFVPELVAERLGWTDFAKAIQGDLRIPAVGFLVALFTTFTRVAFPTTDRR